MTQEEKARAYDEALEKARKYLEDEGFTEMADVFPELAESEDERIRKWLVNYFKAVGKSWIHRDISPEQIIAYLEKQKVNTEGDFGRGYDCGYQAGYAVAKNEMKPKVATAVLDSEKQKEQKEIPLMDGDADLYFDNWIQHNNATKRECFEAGMTYLYRLLNEQKEQKPEWKPQPESLEALMYAIKGKWDMISPTSYLSRRLEDLYEGLVNTFNVDASRAYTAKDIEELRGLKRKIEASIKQKPAEWSDYKDKIEVPYRSSEPEWSEEQDYSDLSDLERAIHRGFLCAGVENVPVAIIKETAKECLELAKKQLLKDDELTKKHLEGYIKGRNDALREMSDFMESHFNTNKGKEGEDLTDLYYKEYVGNPQPIPTGIPYQSPQCGTNVTITPNTNSGTSTLKAEG